MSSIASSTVANGVTRDGCQSPHRVIVTSRSTYLASTSASRLTSSPGSSAPSVVSVERVRDERDGEARVVEGSATVSEVPSTAIEPFSTQ